MRNLFITNLHKKDVNHFIKVINVSKKQFVEIGCSKNNRYCERLLQDLYVEAGIPCSGGYLYDFSQKTDNEKNEILSSLFDLAGYYTYAFFGLIRN